MLVATTLILLIINGGIFYLAEVTKMVIVFVLARLFLYLLGNNQT